MAGLRMMVGVLAVLGTLPDRLDTELYGLEIMPASGLEPGTIYPIQRRLRAAGWVSNRWKDFEPGRTAGRAPRGYCRLTVESRARTVHALHHGRDRSGMSRFLSRRDSRLGPTTPIRAQLPQSVPQLAWTSWRPRFVA